MVDVIVEVAALAGAVLVLLGGIGVIRFPDVYARMHAATKVSTLGMALIGTAATVTLDGGRAKTILAVAFIFITAPSAAHFVGRAAYRAEGIDIDLAARDDLGTLIDGPAPPEARPDERPAPGADGSRTRRGDER